MTLSEYQTITGITVSSANTARVTAELANTQTILESLLGYTLTPADVDTNYYSETGKTSLDCACPDVDVDDLLPPDPVVYAYRLFPYNVHDVFFHVDPFTALHKVKLVYNNITVKTFDSDEIRSVVLKNGLKKYIERLCECGFYGSRQCVRDVQLAVDATWLYSDPTAIPRELLLVQAQMTTWYADVKNKVKQESIGPHSYTLGDNPAPEHTQSVRKIISRYAGPYGDINRAITI